DNLSKLDSGERALLKRSAGRPLAEAGKAMFLFYQKVLPHGVPRRQEESYFLVATLYPFDKRLQGKEPAEQKQTAAESTAGNLGESLRRGRTSQNEAGLNRQMPRLLDADGQQLPFQLRRTVLRLTNDWIAINWQQLTNDVLEWQSPGRHVQKAWARAYVALSQE